MVRENFAQVRRVVLRSLVSVWSMSLAGVLGGVAVVCVGGDGGMAVGVSMEMSVERGMECSAGVSCNPGVDSMSVGRCWVCGQSGVVNRGDWASSERVGLAGRESWSWWWMRVADSSW